MSSLRDPDPVECAALFVPLMHQLIRLLDGLAPSDWDAPTVAPRWRVRDVVAHLLDGDLRKLSLGRDRHRLETGPIDSYRDLVTFIDGINASGVSYATRLSPRIMIDLLAVTGDWVGQYVASLAPFDKARIPVAWAGESRSANWMDIAREYSERWHHQMQIRDAVGAPLLLLEPQWFDPLIDVSVRALPVAYRDVHAADGTAVTCVLEGEVARYWSVVREGERWSVKSGRAPEPAASVTTDADTAWRWLFNALSREALSARVTIHGDVAMAEPMLDARSVMV